jgi:hypothetical protein
LLSKNYHNREYFLDADHADFRRYKERNQRSSAFISVHLRPMILAAAGGRAMEKWRDYLPEENPMLNRLQQTIQRLANGRAILILLAAVIALRVLMGLPNDPFGLNAHLARLGGAAILDMRICYTPDDAYALLEALGSEGRLAYATMLLGGDILFPISYSLLFAAIALIGGISDIAENLSILTMIFAFPQRLDGVAWFSSLIKITKFGSGAIGVPLIVVLAVILMWQRIAGRQSPLKESHEKQIHN